MTQADAYPSFTLPLTPSNALIERCPVPRENASHRILIMRAGAHGDILMGTPLLAALRRAWPDAHITWIVERKERDAIDANPYVDELLLWDSAYWKKMLRRALYPLWALRALRLRRQLRARRYDIFISFQPEEWPLLQRGVHAPLTIGIFDTFRRFYRAARTSPNTRLYTHAYAYPDLPPHRIDQYLLALDALGLPKDVSYQMQMGFTNDDKAAACQFLLNAGVAPSERIVVLAPMTTWPSKCWPGERYVRLGDTLAAQHGCRIVLIGSAKERETIAAIAAQMHTPPIIAAGDLTFRQMAALLAQAQLVVSGDTGPMHVAAAVGTPYVALFGATGVDWYGPLTGPGTKLAHAVPCGPCDQKLCPLTGPEHMQCLRLISVEEASEAAEAFLSAPVAVP